MKITTSLAKLKANLNARYLDGIATTPNALTSATASFVAGDVGKQIVGPPSIIKPGTTIATVTNGTTVVLVHGSGTAVYAVGSPHPTVDFRIAGRERTTISVPLITLPAAGLIRRLVNNAATALTSQHDKTLTDFVLNSDTSLVSATIAFVAADVGKTVSGTGIPTNTKIASVTNGTTAVLDTPTTVTGASKTVKIVNREKLTAATMRAITPGHNYGTAKSALVANVPDADYTPFLESMTATKVLSMQVVLTGDNLSGLTGGSIDTYLDYDVLN